MKKNLFIYKKVHRLKIKNTWFFSHHYWSDCRHTSCKFQSQFNRWINQLGYKLFTTLEPYKRVPGGGLVSQTHFVTLFGSLKNPHLSLGRLFSEENYPRQKRVDYPWNIVNCSPPFLYYIPVDIKLSLGLNVEL